MNEYVKNIIKNRQKQLEAQRKSATEELEYAKAHLKAVESSLNDIESELAGLYEEVK